MSNNLFKTDDNNNLLRIALVILFLLGVYRLFQGREFVAILLFLGCYFLYQKLEQKGGLLKPTITPDSPSGTIKPVTSTISPMPNSLQKPRILDANVLNKLKEPALSPINIEIYNLRKGYIFDFDTKCWTVRDMKLIFPVTNDIYAGKVEKDVYVESELELYNLRFDRDEPAAWLPMCRKINPYTLDPQLDQYKTSNAEFPSVYNYQEEKYFREPSTASYSISPEDNTYEQLKSIVYYNENKTKYLRIDLLKNDFLCWVGDLVPTKRFQNILPPA